MDQLNDHKSKIVESILKQVRVKLEDTDNSTGLDKLVKSLTSSVLFKKNDEELALEILQIRANWLDVYRDFIFFEKSYLNDNVSQKSTSVWHSFHEELGDLRDTIEESSKEFLIQRLDFIDKICKDKFSILTTAKLNVQPIKITSPVVAQSLSTYA